MFSKNFVVAIVLTSILLSILSCGGGSGSESELGKKNTIKGIYTVRELFDRTSSESRPLPKVFNRIEKKLTPTESKETVKCKYSGYYTKGKFYDDLSKQTLNGRQYFNCSYYDKDISLDGTEAWAYDSDSSKKVYENYRNTYLNPTADYYSYGIVIGYGKEGYEHEGTYTLKASFGKTYFIEFNGGYIDSTIWKSNDDGHFIKKTVHASLDVYPFFSMMNDKNEGVEWNKLDITSILEYHPDQFSAFYVKNVINTNKSISKGGHILNYELRTIKPFEFFNESHPSQGVMDVFNITENLKTRLTALTNGKVKLETDIDGDGTYDENKTVNWSDILFANW